MEDLLRKPLVVFQQGCSYRRRLEDIQTKYGIVPDGVMEMNSLGAILASVIAGLGVSLFPESTLASIQESRYLTVTELSSTKIARLDDSGRVSFSQSGEHFDG